MMANLFREVGGGRTLTRIETLDSRIWGGKDALQSMGPLEVQRRGKLLVLCDSDRALLLHLRMTGQICREADHRPPRLRFCFDSGEHLVLLDQRCLAQAEWVPRDVLEAVFAKRNLGEEFWPKERSGAWWASALGGKSGDIKPALLSQDRVVGVGNIAASELLWRAHISPFQRASSLDLEAWESLARAADAHVNHCLSKETADTLKFVTAGGPNFFLVYGREGQSCPRCQDRIRREMQRGRATFWCPSCQS